MASLHEPGDELENTAEGDMEVEEPEDDGSKGATQQNAQKPGPQKKDTTAREVYCGQNITD